MPKLLPFSAVNQSMALATWGVYVKPNLWASTSSIATSTPVGGSVLKRWGGGPRKDTFRCFP